MADSANVLVALTGNILVAPVGTTAPTSTDDVWTTIDPLWVDLGYISEDGIVEEHDDQSAEIKAWQGGDTIRRLITGSSASYTFTVIETTAAALELYYKGSTVGGTDPGPGDISITSPTADPRAFGIDVIDGDKIVRSVIPNGEVTERGSITQKADESVSYELTVTAYPAASTGIHTIRYYSELPGLGA